MQECDAYLYNTENRLTQDGYDSCSTRLLPAETVAVSSRATVGDCIIFGREICTNQGFVNVVCNERMNNVFLLYWLRQNKRELLRLAAGTTFNEIGRGAFKKLQVLRPIDPREQSAIAKSIGTVDVAIAAALESIAKAERLQKGLMQQLLTGRIRPDGTPRKPDEFWVEPKLGLIPSGWIVKKGWQLADKITKGQSPKWQGFDYTSSGMLFVTSENVRDGFLDLGEPKYLPIGFNEKIKGSELRVGDVLINLVGASIGRSCIYESGHHPANVNQAVCVFRPKAGVVSKYLGYYLRLNATQNRLLSSQVETARCNLSLGDVRKLKFIIPSDEQEQVEIVGRLSMFTQLIEAKQQKIFALQRLKKSLMQNLLTGRIRLPVGCGVERGGR